MSSIDRSRPIARHIARLPRAQMLANADVSRLMSRVVDQVDQLTVRATSALFPALLDARQELVSDLRRWLSRGVNMDETFTAQHMRAMLAQCRGGLEAMRALRPEVVGKLSSGAVAAARLGIEHVESQIVTFSGAFGEAHRIDIAVAGVLAEGRRQLVPRYEKSAARYSEEMQADFRYQLAVGMLKGETIDQMTRRVMQLGERKIGKGGTADEMAEGFFLRQKYNAARLTRTEAINAYNVHHIESLWEANRTDPGYLKRWDAAADGTCKLCRSFDDQVADLDGDFEGLYGVTVQQPTAHPHCRCRIIPWRLSWGAVIPLRGGVRFAEPIEITFRKAA